MLPAVPTDTQQAMVGGPLTAIFPLPEFWPTLCVMDDADYPEAMLILRDAQEPGAPPQPEWTCEECGETVPGHFALCWNLGHGSDRA